MASLPQPLSDLLDARAYHHPVARIELVETHISWVLLTGELAYKIKRPVQHAFVDLRSPERRAFFCQEEIRLNRRFAPDLYLDVCKVTVDDGGRVRMGGEGRVIEHAVRMKQFDRAQELDRLLAASAIEPDELACFGKDLAAIHAALPVATSDEKWGRADSIAKVILGNLTEVVRDAGVFQTSREIESIAPRLRERVRAAAEWMTVRRESGRVRECHGDLHARNILRRDARLVAFDSMEFDPALRWIDVADEVAFLFADLEARGYPAHAHAFLNSYLLASGDYHACHVLDVYRAHRAVVRAKVEALTAAGKDSNALERARDRHLAYVESARAALASRRLSMILMSGLSGSGKTWLAERLAAHLRALHLRSDVERQRLFEARGFEEPGTGRYAPNNLARVYEHLAQCADDALSGGYSVIVDATFRDQDQRTRFRQLASRLDADLRVVYCRANEETLRKRIDQRVRDGQDASEANESVLAWQRDRFDPIREAEGLEVIDVDMTREGAVEDALRRLADA